MLDQITVVLPAKNERHNLPLFLASLPPALFLIIVDDSRDGTAGLALRRRPQRTRVIHRPSTVTEARQIGANLAQTPWLLFSDADVHFPPNYFARLGGWLPVSDAVYGPKRSADRFHHYYDRFSRGQARLHRLGIPAVSGSNLLVRRETLAAAGGFDLQLSVNEDTELGWRIKRAGFKINFAPDLPVYTHDQRRLERGRARKTWHSLLRCTLLYTGLMPARWRAADWGYWAGRDRQQGESGSYGG